MARIGISAVALDPNRTGGAETYIRQLLGCPEFHHVVRKHELFVFVGDPCDPALKNCGFRLIRCPTSPVNRSRRLLWEQYALPDILNRHQLDLVHFPYSAFSWTYRKPLVVTVHDTTNFIMPRSVSLTERIYRAVLQRRLVHHPCAHVIVPSRTDREVFVSHLKLPPDHCHPVHHGHPRDFQIAKDQVGIPRPGGGLLWVGRAYHHKNIDLLFHVTAELSRRMGQHAPRLRLVGIEPRRKDRLAHLARKLGILSLVDIDPPASHASLRACFRQARVLVYPSTYESFGLPPLEAMCSGTPVVCSDIPIFREVLGEAALYGDPARSDTFANACAALLQDQDAWRRQARRGYEHAQRYTWTRCASVTAAVYEQAMRSAHAHHNS